MKRILIAIFLLAILPVPSATAGTHRRKAPKINYKKRYIAQPYNRHHKQQTARYGSPKR